jgi:hypothetical protein
VRISHFSGHALSICAAAAFLAGCGASQPPIAAPGAMAQTSTIATQAERAGSWMLPEATTDDLLYVTDTTKVSVYSYPRGKLVGSLRFGLLPGGDCADQRGNVFVTNSDNGEIVEYAHGGTKRIAVLHSPSGDPLGCAIDPTTGNLAVSSLGSGNNGGVAIYQHARGNPTTYQNPAFQEYWYCGYDDTGNLYVDGQDANSVFEFAELAKGGNTLKSVTLNQTIGWPGGVQWDGQHLAVADQNNPPTIVYEFAIKQNHGTKVGTTMLASSGGVGEFNIVGKRLIAPNQCAGSCTTGNVRYYDYPAGGSATKIISKDVRYPHGAAVSIAQK